MKRIYLDYAAVTPVDAQVMKTIQKMASAACGNPSAIHGEGVKAKKLLDQSRQYIAKLFRCQADELIFTGSGTEANNLAILGTFAQLAMPKKQGGLGKMPQELHFITSEIEHASVLECAHHLEELGVKVEYAPVDAQGIVDVKVLKEMIRPNTFMVSVMAVNNEIGTLQPISEIAKLVRRAKKENELVDLDQESRTSSFAPFAAMYPYFHSDASQAPLYTEMNMQQFGADLVTFDSHKVYGPRGVGMLIARRGVSMRPLVRGGGQERGLRSGTENVPGIIGLAKAFDIAFDEQAKETARLSELRDFFIQSLQEQFPHAVINGDLISRIAHNVNVSFPDVDTEFLLVRLDSRGVACSTKSSCLRDEDESYVIRALRRAQKMPPGKMSHALRFSLGRATSKADIVYVLKLLAAFVK